MSHWNDNSTRKISRTWASWEVETRLASGPASRNAMGMFTGLFLREWRLGGLFTSCYSWAKKKIMKWYPPSSPRTCTCSPHYSAAAMGTMWYLRNGRGRRVHHSPFQTGEFASTGIEKKIKNLPADTSVKEDLYGHPLGLVADQEYGIFLEEWDT